ncbi:thioredoxin family protein [Sulfurimonas sp. C5]|uniref:thioredoxin family protein n=1 Tax=Sulfurimonas sp. C5 TaxID=3036947 RepID=UPI0024567047|nr:thioredoxin family protein [Sulfurimonas sp. C5]MDH4945121.1 thioredoxin family protein [Sulfurimonas sp. C5]
MKKVILIMMLLTASIFANEIHWAQDFESGAATAKKEHKPILFVFSRHTCKYCVLLERTTFANKKVIDALNKDFVSIIAYSDEGDQFPQMLWRPGTPTLWFLDENAEPMYQPLMGAVGEEYFIEALKVVKKEFDSRKK